MRSIHFSIRSAAVAALLAAVSATPSFAAAGDPAAEIQARYQQERAACFNGRSNQDQATCLKEAAAARDEARRGRLDEGDTSYRRNAKARCDALTGDEARDCRARMNGKGTVSGSVEGGGIYRETITREVKPADAPAPAAPPAAPR